MERFAAGCAEPCGRINLTAALRAIHRRRVGRLGRGQRNRHDAARRNHFTVIFAPTLNPWQRLRPGQARPLTGQPVSDFAGPNLRRQPTCTRPQGAPSRESLYASQLSSLRVCEGGSYRVPGGVARCHADADVRSASTALQ